MRLPLRIVFASFFIATLPTRSYAFPSTTNLTAEGDQFLHSPSSPHVTPETSFPVGAYQPRPAHDPSLQQKREAVQDAVKHAWDAYATFAWGHDELRPLSRAGGDTFAAGLGTTIIDSLSTLYILGGLNGRYAAAREWVATQLDLSSVGRVIVFETVIRILGGLLSAFQLTGDALFLEKAQELGARLAGGFETHTGYPWPRCFLNETGRCEGHQTMGDGLYLAEVGSVQLEFRALAAHSGHALPKRLRDVTEAIVDRLQMAGSATARLTGAHAALLPFVINRVSGNYSTNMVTLGAPADSYFEYLVKVWVQGGKRERRYWELFAQVVDGMAAIATYTSRHGDTIVRDVFPARDGSVAFSHKMDHFACYVPGMIVLGLDGLGDDEHQRRLQWEGLAESLTETCYKMYVKSPSGLAGEHIRLGNEDEWRMSGGYQLRPEAVEAFFYMYRHTKNEKYREYAWTVFEQIEEHCKVREGGYAALKTAKSRHPRKEDVMHSFFISETLKYIYLIMGDDEEELPLEHWVFNTEAHPLLVTPGLSEKIEVGVGRRKEEHDEL